MTTDNDSPKKKNEPLPDPRDYLANERTYHAWIGTSVGMVFGFVVVKFRMFVKQMSLIFQKPVPSHE